MSTNRMLGPSDGMTIRQPTDKGLKKGNVQNPPRYTNLGMGGLDGPQSPGLEASEFAQRPPGETLRKVPNVKGSRD